MGKTPLIITVIFIIIIAYIAAIVIIDPYNYFDTGIVNQDVKTRIAIPLNQRLAKIIEYKQNPSPNLLLGDSRIQNLNSDKIKEVTNITFFNFGYGASSIPELVDNFWYASKYQKLENVYIGISFSMYNKYFNKNLFSDAVKSSKLFYYIFNRINFEVMFYMVKDLISKEKIMLGNPTMNKDQFWKEKINVETSTFYKLYKYPDEYYQELKKIQVYCKNNGINIIYFIPPTYIEVQEKIKMYSLIKENQKFKDDIKSLGKVYDFDYDSEFTRNKDNFSDPFHFKRESGPILINIIFRDSANFVNLDKTN